MKKNLLALFAFGAMYNASAQDTYIKDAVIVKVNPNTLFYNGGNVNVTTDVITGTTEKIINEGNIQIKGGFTNTNTIGKNFLNRYNTATSYGQLIIKNSTAVSGNIAMEKTKIDVINNQYSPIGLPFQGDLVKNIFNNITSSNSFQGDCALNTNCGNNRYNQTILVWDVNESEYDAVTNSSTVTPGQSYTINVQNGAFRAFLQGLSANKFSMFGKPNNSDFFKSGIESGIRNTPKATFSGYKWSDWKNNVNSYNETYTSYLGPGTGMDSNVRYAKNLHRFSNPYTSNLDLSDVSKSNSWIKILIGGVEKTPTELYDTTLRFKVTKLPIDYNVNWNGQTGGSNNGTRISAYLSKPGGTNPYAWVGNPDALIIKPFEYFEIDYYTLVSSLIGNTNIVTTNYYIGDNQKTFDYDFTSRGSGSGTFARGVTTDEINKSNLLNDEFLQSRGLIVGNDFTQIEFFLTENNDIKGEAAYLVNGSFYKTGDATSPKATDNTIFLYEEDTNGNVIESSQTLLNQFNSLDYIGKPLRIGFHNLDNGSNYSINLRIFEESILNKVNDLSLGKYYLLDKQTNNITEVNSNTQIKFVADNNINNRFELYWNEKPTVLGTDDINKNKTTYLYSKENDKYVRFENNNTTATIEIYDVSGRLVSRHLNVKTNADYKLDLINTPILYIVKIIYKDGKVISEKTTNK